ncbi:TRAP transporter substrate-binding protein [Phaeovulum sp. W22_SRMD_FR3]|uniref:TRAP transporter substrate-binding protein n=1 Tax=Phaeovulum sp. W22_SRMD_FR3 TaxID=3240274 RepID=UPI003F95FF3D
MKKLLLCAAWLGMSISAAGPVLAADFTLKVSSPTNNDVILKWMEAFEQKLEAATDGAIDVQLFPANQLGQIPATVEGVAMGTIEVTAPASSFFVQYDRRFEVLDVPGLFDDLGHAQKVLSDPEVLDHLEKFGADQDLHPIAAFPHGPLGVLSAKGIDTLAALQGQRIRVAGPSALATGPFSALGAAPISMPLGEVLPAMQNGVVDGLIAGLPVFTTGRYYDVAKDLTVLPESYLIVTAVASQSFLDSIGEDLSAKLRTAAREAITDANAWNLSAVEGVRAVWEQNGGTVKELSAADQKAFLDAVQASLPDAKAQNPSLEDEISFLQSVAARYAAP